MHKYILFIDTETSDKPRKWKTPTARVEKWPYILQISWSLYTETGEELFVRNYFINPGEIKINDEALKLHGISLEFLHEQGSSREFVLQQLSADLLKFEPLVVGHFLQFDLKMLEVGFNRTNIKHNLDKLAKFCTMINTRSVFYAGRSQMLRLGELYSRLFKQELTNQHDALVDSQATKECFFELVKRGEIDDDTIRNQQKKFKNRRRYR